MAMDFYTDFPFQPLECQAAFAADAEAAGYSGIFATENRHDPFLCVAAAARRGRNIYLGTGVTALLAHNPFTVAQMAWDLQYNSGGRFILGIGTHHDNHLIGRFGLSAKDKHARLVEAVAVIREIWQAWFDDRDAKYAGTYYSIQSCPPGYRPTTMIRTRPSIYLLCSAWEDVKIAPLVADGIFLHPMWTPAFVDKVVRPAVVAWRQSGAPITDVRVVDGGIVATGAGSGDLESSRSRARSCMSYYFLKADYDDVYASLGVLEGVQRFRREAVERTINWSSPYLQDLYHEFVTEAQLPNLGAALAARCSSVVTGVFPNIVSVLPRLMPQEVVADIRSRTPGEPYGAKHR
jgi:hypothetical protein